MTYFVNYIDRQVAFSVFPALRQDLGFTTAQLALVGTVFTWVYSLAMPVSGRFADLVPRHRLILGSLILWSLCTLGTGLSTSVRSFLFWRAAMGITESMYVPAALGLLASVLPPHSKSRGFAVHMTAQLAGIAVGGSFGGWSADTIGWRSGFFWLAAVGIGYAPVLAFVFSRLQLSRPAAVVRSDGKASDVLRSRCFLALGLGFLLFCVLLWIQYAWFANHLYERFHVSMTEAGFAAMVFLQVSCGAGVLLGGFAADRIAPRAAAGRFYVAAAGLVLSGPFAWASFAAGTLTSSVACACGFGLFSGFMMSNVFPSAYEVIAPRNYGFAAGLLNMAGGLAGGAGILGAGVLKESIGISALSGGAALATALSGLMLIAVVQRRFAVERCPA